MKKALLIALCIVLWIGSVDAQSKRRKAEAAEADAIIDQLLLNKERAERKDKATTKWQSIKPCGVNVTLGEFLDESELDWRLIGKSSDEYYYYNTQSITCTPTGVLRFWIKTHPIPSRRKRTGIEHTLQQLEVRCNSDQIRTINNINYSGDGNVKSSLTVNDEWEDIVPDSMGRRILIRVCHK